MIRRLFPLFAVIGLIMLMAPPPVASAHGERGQQAFERTSTVLFYDVKFSTTTVDINAPLTITGTLRVMNSWPDHTIGPPELGYLTVNEPGPVLSVQERWMSGMFTPQSVNLTKGGVYPFKIVLKGRVPGTWHVHPVMAVKGTGTLMGPGQFVTVNNAGGPFTEMQQLSDGRTVDLARYGLPRVAWWHILGFLFGAGYVWYWLRQNTLNRLLVVNAGEGATLVTKKERRVSVLFAIVALVLGIGGFVYATVSDGPHIPLQVARVTPMPELPNALGAGLNTTVQKAVFQEKTGKLDLSVKVTNNTDQPVTFDHLQFADYIVASPDAVEQVPAEQRATVTPSGAIPPKQTREMTVSLDARALRNQNLLPLNDAQIRLTGLMFFRDAKGQTSATEINELTSGILPQYG